MSRGRRALALLGPAVLLPALGLLFYGAAGRDDAYITYWAAKALAAGDGIVSYNGERLEQSSSLLHTLLLAALTKLTSVSVPTLGFVLGIGAGAATVVVAGLLAGRIDPRARLLAGLLVATSAYLVYWSFGGLETALVPLALLLALWAAAATLEAGRTAGRLALAALAILAYVAVRPEGGPVLVASFGGLWVLALVLARRPRGADHAVLGRPRDIFALLAITGAAIAALVVFRLAYFGAPVPQPVSAKVDGLQIGDGLHYVWRWLKLPHMLITLGAVAVALPIVLRRPRPLTALLALALVATTGFVVTAGGDWMEAGRMLVPPATLAAILIAAATVQLPRAALIGAGLVVVQLAGVLQVARSYSTGRPAWSDIEVAGLKPDQRAAIARAPFYERANRVHVRDIAFLQRLDTVVARVRVPGRELTVASGQAGLAVYYVFSRYADRVRFIDLGSLTTDAFAGCRGDLVHTQLGASPPSLSFWFANQRRCGVAAPDVFFNVGTPNDPALRRDYRIVYRQPPVPIATGAEHFPGGPTSLAEYIAVRRSLIPR